MRVLVTGGSGFIGSYVCKELESRGMSPLVFDHNLRGFHHGPGFFGDVRDYTSVSEAVAICDGVIHLAGVLGTQETIKEPRPSVETNIFGSLNVFKACAHYNRPCVYIGVGNYWMENSYSITKTTAERFARMFATEFGARIKVVRAMNAYGPGQKIKPIRKIVPNFAVPAIEGRPITIYGDGRQIMDMIYVEDVASVLVEALVTNAVVDSHHVFEAGTGKSTTVLQIAEEVVRIAKGREPFPEDFEFVPMRPGEPPNSKVLGNPSTLEPLGINAANFVTLEDGLRRTVAWYREQLG